MKSVKTKDTSPEQTVRKALFAAGYRYRLHRGDLPGTPDIVFPSKKKITDIPQVASGLSETTPSVGR